MLSTLRRVVFDCNRVRVTYNETFEDRAIRHGVAFEVMRLGTVEISVFPIGASTQRGSACWSIRTRVEISRAVEESRFRDES